MRNGVPNISKVASDLIMAYQQLTKWEKETIVSPRYEKTAMYLPQSPIEEQIDEENQIDSPRKVVVVEDDDDYLLEISELRKIVDKMRMKYMNIPEKYEKQPLQSTNSLPVQKKKPKNVVITSYQTDFLRQQYGKLK